MQTLLKSQPTLRYVAPFAIYLVLLAVSPYVPLGPVYVYPLRILITSAVLAMVSLPLISYRCSRPWSTVALGILVFAIWIVPDVLWPSYRQHWIFHNSITGEAASSIPWSDRSNIIFLFLRIFGTAVTIPIIEELFWRGWLMRYLIAADFEKLPLGSYTRASFWITAALFATEHGAFWDVGLIAGILYNWWLLRTRVLADCIVAHAVTNGCLAVYVLASGEWQYWL